MNMKESPQAVRAFADYVNQGPRRSLERLAEEYQRSPKGVPTRQLSRLKKWSRAHAWADRVLAHERQIAEEAATKARQQRLQVARAARDKGVEALAQMAPSDLARLPSAVVRLLEYADITERRDLGEPDQRVELSGPEGDALTIRVIYDDPIGEPEL